MRGGYVGVSAFGEAEVYDVHARALHGEEDQCPSFIGISQRQLEQIAVVSHAYTRRRRQCQEDLTRDSPLFGGHAMELLHPHPLSSRPGNPHGEIRWFRQLLLLGFWVERECAAWKWNCQYRLSRVNVVHRSAGLSFRLTGWLSLSRVMSSRGVVRSGRRGLAVSKVRTVSGYCPSSEGEVQHQGASLRSRGR